MKQIGIYHPKHTSSLLYFNHGEDLDKWFDLGYKVFHENNKGYLFIDWTPLFNWLNKELNLDVEFKIDLSEKRPQIVCPNLADKSGIFNAVFREVLIDFFSFGTTLDEDSKVIGFWATVNLWHHLWASGSNGSQLGTVWYDSVVKEWKCETSKARTLRSEKTRHSE